MYMYLLISSLHKNEYVNTVAVQQGTGTCDVCIDAPVWPVLTCLPSSGYGLDNYKTMKIEVSHLSHP